MAKEWPYQMEEEERGGRRRRRRKAKLLETPTQDIMPSTLSSFSISHTHSIKNQEIKRKEEKKKKKKKKAGLALLFRFSSPSSAKHTN